MSSSSKWTEADVLKVLLLDLKGVSRVDIVAQTGISSSSVGRFLRSSKPDPRYSQAKLDKDEAEHERLLAKAKAQLASERAGVGDASAGGAEASTSAAVPKAKGKAREVAAPYVKPAPSSRRPVAPAAPAEPPISRGIILPPPTTAQPLASSSNPPPAAAPAPTGAFWPSIIDLISRTLPDFSSSTPSPSSQLPILPASYSTSFGSTPARDLPEAYSTSFGTRSSTTVEQPPAATSSLANPTPAPVSSTLPTPTLVPVPPLPRPSFTPGTGGERMEEKLGGM